MKFAVWILRAFLFVALFALALRNTDDATLNLFFGYAWHAPLILIVLAFFFLGSVFGLMAAVPALLRQRLDLVRGRRKADAAAVPPGTIV